MDTHPDDGVSKTTCVIVGAPLLVRDALRALLESSGMVSVLGDANGVTDLLPILDARRPDAVLLMADLVSDGAEALMQRLPEIADRTCLLLVTGTADPTVASHVVELGARGVVTTMHSGQVLVKALRKVGAGEVWLDRASTAAFVNKLTRRHAPVDPEIQRIASLTPRERQIVELVTEGCTNQDIAARLSITQATARNHLTSILDKLDVDDRFQLAVYAFRRGLVPTPQTPAALRAYAIMNERARQAPASTAPRSMRA
jgi:two-component system, NarL family, nitrate/nitrite response regulator NarL